MKKFGTPIGAGPGRAKENVGFAAVGTPPADRGGGGALFGWAGPEPLPGAAFRCAPPLPLELEPRLFDPPDRDGAEPWLEEPWLLGPPVFGGECGVLLPLLLLDVVELDDDVVEEVGALVVVVCVLVVVGGGGHDSETLDTPGGRPRLEIGSPCASW
jgi:hypothetical protein